MGGAAGRTTAYCPTCSTIQPITDSAPIHAVRKSWVEDEGGTMVAVILACGHSARIVTKA